MEGTGKASDAGEGTGSDRLPSEKEVEERTEKDAERLDDLVEKVEDAQESVGRKDERP